MPRSLLAERPALALCSLQQAAAAEVGPPLILAVKAVQALAVISKPQEGKVERDLVVLPIQAAEAERVPNLEKAATVEAVEAVELLATPEAVLAADMGAVLLHLEPL
jgi:hypothetical protein